MRRRALKRDLAEPPIVQGMEQVGALVFRMHTPADLLVYFRRQWFVMEVKTGLRKRKDQPKQDEFLRLTETPKIRTVDAALRHIGAMK